jgi:hypothetical protein
LGAVLCAGLAAGCVERRFVVNTDPPGAVVLRNTQPIGLSPADDHFVYYGTYKFTLVHDGYERMQVDQKIPAPWYEYPPFDFIVENIIPWKIIDRREFFYKLQPVQVVRPDELLNQAGGLRLRGQGLVPPPGSVPAPQPDAELGAPRAVEPPLPPASGTSVPGNPQRSP